MRFLPIEPDGLAVKLRPLDEPGNGLTIGNHLEPAQPSVSEPSEPSVGAGSSDDVR